MPNTEITIAEMLKQKNYQTGMVGKWHLGHQPEYLPTAQGFDMYYGIPFSNDMWQALEIPLAKNVTLNEGLTVTDYKRENPKKKFRSKMPIMLGNEVVEWPVNQSQLTKKYTEKAKQFISENKENPFFLYLAHSMPHIPLFASKEFAGKTERGLFGDVIEEIDWSVGEILKTLKAQGLDKNTMVIFTSDNGPWLSKKLNAGSAGPFRDGKFSPYEDGSRVPCIVWQPGTVPNGVVSNIQTSTLDILPTFASIAGISIPKDRNLDGLNITEVLKGNNSTKLDRPYYLFRGDAIRIGDWKYVKIKKNEELFNLAKDKEESKNIIKQFPEKAKTLADKLESVKASFK